MEGRSSSENIGKLHGAPFNKIPLLITYFHAHLILLDIFAIKCTIEE
jgi:hypothetical protein